MFGQPRDHPHGGPMFEQPRDHPHGGPLRYNNGHFPGFPVGMTAGAPYQPSYARGRGVGGGGVPGIYQPPLFPGPGSYQDYQGYPLPNRGPPPLGRVYSPPLPGSPPREAPPPPPSTDGCGRSGLKCDPPPPPAAPKDVEMLKNIEVLSLFVAKNGPQFENMARQKQADNPKFAFLFGGERGTEASIGLHYYEWKKENLAWEERSKPPSATQTRLSELNEHPEDVGGVQLSHEVPRSPTGSDMDMEDDFAVTPPTCERKSAFDRGPGLSPKRERRSGFSSPVELSSQTSERKIGPTSPGFERRSRFSSPVIDRKVATAPLTTERTSEGSFSLSFSEPKAGSSSSVPIDEKPLHQGSNRWNPAEMVSSDLDYPGVEREKGSQGPDTAKTEKEGGLSDLPRRKDSRRRTGFDRPCMEDVSLHTSPSKYGEPKEKQRESAASIELERKGVPPHPDVPTKPSRWGPPESGPTHQGARDLVSDKGPGTGEMSSVTKGYKRSGAFHHRGEGEESLTEDRRQSRMMSGKLLRVNDDTSARDSEKPKSRSVSDLLAVDEFGRLLRQGGSDSDGESHHGGGKKRRRSMSRSRTRSRSPGDSRRKRWSPSRSPHRRDRRSRSWSASPRRQRSRSRSPPREGRWAGEGRGERGYTDRGGRRGGRGGGPQQACFDFAKGRCQRGASCRFLHEESNGLADDQGGRWSGGRGRGRGRGRSARDAAEDGERNWGGKGGDQPRPWKSWNSSERNTDDDSREEKLIEELKKQEGESSTAEAWEQRKGDGAAAPGSTSAAEQGPVEHSTLQSDRDSAGPATSQQIKSPSEYMCEALSPSIPSSQSNQIPQQTGGLPNPVASPQQPNYPTAMTRQYNTPLSAHLPQHPSFSPSPSSQPQQPKYTLSHSQPQHNNFPPLQHSGYSLNIPHKSGFVVNRQQQPTFTPSPVSYSGNSSMPTQPPPPFASLPMLRPHPSFSAPQQQNFASPVSVAMSMPMSVGIPTDIPTAFRLPVSVPLSSGQASLMLRTPVMNTPSQMLQAPMGPNLTTRLGFSWTSPGMGPLVSYGPPPQQALQQPSAAQPQTQSLPPQVSVPQQVSYQYAPSLLPAYAVASFSTLAAQVMAPSSVSSNDQYDPLADSLEPGPPGAGDKKVVASHNQNRQVDNGSRQSTSEQWKLQSAGETTPIMTNAGEVVLENVSPGLPGHIDSVRSNIVVLENVSPRRPVHMVMENVSPANVGSSFNINSTMNYGGTHQAVTMESLSPAPDRNPTEDGQKDPADGSKDQKKKDKDSRILNLIRKAVAEHVKDLLKPTWKEGQMSKDAFKTIAKKAVDKVMGALEAKGSIPKSQEKLDLFMDTSKPKIAKLVKGYVDKYVKA